MAFELANYSIESDTIVALTFRDGRSLRAKIEHLSGLVSVEDHTKIIKSLKLRASYISSHTPSWAKYVMLAGGVLALGFGSVKAEHWYQQGRTAMANLTPRPAAVSSQPTATVSTSNSFETVSVSSTPTASESTVEQSVAATDQSQPTVVTATAPVAEPAPKADTPVLQEDTRATGDLESRATQTVRQVAKPVGGLVNSLDHAEPSD